MYIHWIDSSLPRKITACNFNLLPSAVQQLNRIGEDTHGLLYILDGSCEVWQDNESLPLRSDDLLFLHAGSQTFGRSSFAPGMSVMFLHFSGGPEDTLWPAGSSPPGKDGFLSIRDIVHCGAENEVKRLFQRIIYNFYSGRPNIEIKLSALLLDLLYELAQLSVEDAPPMAQDDVVEWVLYRIRTAPQSDCSLQTLSKQTYMSPATLSERFKKATGKTIYRYQLETRLAMARALLLSAEDMPLREVARVYGFCDEYHFSKLFKRFYHQSPSVFRLQHRAAKEPHERESPAYEAE